MVQQQKLSVLFQLSFLKAQKTLLNAKTNGVKGRKVKIQMLFLSNIERTIDKAVGNGQHNSPVFTDWENSGPAYIFEKDNVNSRSPSLFECACSCMGNLKMRLTKSPFLVEGAAKLCFD